MALSRRGKFAKSELVVKDYGARAGGWSKANHPRFVADVNGDKRADIVGFGDKGVFVTLSARR